MRSEEAANAVKKAVEVAVGAVLDTEAKTDSANVLLKTAHNKSKCTKVTLRQCKDFQVGKQDF
jgi:hypothetical protein